MAKLDNYDDLYNEGSGFDLEDDQDLDELIAVARAGEHDPVLEDDTVPIENYFNNTSDSEDDVEETPVVEHVEEVEETYYEPAPVRESIGEVRYVEPAPEPEPVRFEPEPKQQVQESSPRIPKVHVPSMEDDRNRVSQIVRIVDAYRRLNSEEKGVVSQFITGGEVIDDETDFIIRTVNVDKSLAVTMKALKDAKNVDPVERAFFVIELNDKTFYSLGDLVAVFTGEDINKRTTKTVYARELVKQIDMLDSKSMNFVEATESVLSASDGESSN